MSRGSTVALTALLAAMPAVGMAAHPALPAPAPSRVLRATDNGVTLFLPQGGSHVTGAIAMMRGAGTPVAGTTGSGTGAANGTGTTVAILVDGLQPGTAAMARVYAGRCGADRSALYTLPPLLVDSIGDASTVAVVTPTSTALTGIHVSVYGLPGMAMNMSGSRTGASNGKQAAPASARLVACGDVHTPAMVIPVKPVSGSRASALAFMSRAPFMLRNVVTNAMEVIVYATGLQPGVAQPEHIHAGPCNTISPVQFPLLDLVSDAMGRAIAGTGLIGVTSVSGMSVHIHATNYAMLACGDIAASGTSGMARAGR